MSREEVLFSSRVPGAESVFFLGCFESRVTLYAQQVRALNLVDAIIASGKVRSNGRVAIIGAGAAGVTAAAAFALEMPHLQDIDLYDRQNVALHLQIDSPHRYLHPHIYDWPEAGALRPEAGLPILDWIADTAGNVAERITQQFSAIQEKHRALHQVFGRRVTEVRMYKGLGCRVFTSSDPNGVDKLYDAVLLSIGFGYERELTDRTYSYWSPMALAGPIRTSLDENDILVSGNGDGGLVDFMTVAFQGTSHRHICEFITRYPGIGTLTPVLLEIEREAWADTVGTSIQSAYRDRILSKLPAGMLLDVAEKLRPAVHIVLHTREPELFRRNTAVLNRFGAFLAIEADRLQERNRITVITGSPFIGSPLDTPVKFQDDFSLTPDYRFLRFGVDVRGNLEPFRQFAEAWSAGQSQGSKSYRPATPSLEPTARSRFDKFRTLAVGALQTAPTPERPVPLLVYLATAPGGMIEWRSNIPFDSLPSLWRDDSPPVHFVCDLPPSDVGPLGPAFARLAGHCKQYHLHAADSHGWIDVMKEYTGRARPGPHIEMKFSFRRGGQPDREVQFSETAQASVLADRIHTALDLDALARLNDVIRRCLHPHPTAEIGWPIESELRGELLALWYRWHSELVQSAERRRRFLLLLASLDDTTPMKLSALVYVGPKTIVVPLARSAILALAVSNGLSGRVGPSETFPGNLLGERITAHASGVSWLDGQDLGPEVLTYPWTTTFVLLSELSAAAEHLRGELRRLDESDEDPLRIGQVSPGEQSIIIGCDFGLRKALATGKEAVRQYVVRIVTARAQASASHLE